MVSSAPDKEEISNSQLRAKPNTHEPRLGEGLLQEDATGGRKCTEDNSHVLHAFIIASAPKGHDLIFGAFNHSFNKYLQSSCLSFKY